VNDIRFALRQLVKFPGFTAVTVLTLAFGICVNTQIFALVNAFFLQPLPFPDADRLTLVLQRSDVWNLPHGLSFPDFRDYRAQGRSLTDLIASQIAPVHLSAEGQPAERTWMAVVTPNAFSAYGVRPALGRMLVAADGEMTATSAAAVLSFDYWKSRFGGDPGVVGRQIMLNNRPFTIVGVAPEGFHGFSWAMAMKVFVPTGAGACLISKDEKMLEHRWEQNWRVMGRLAPGATVKTANAEAEVIGRKLCQEFPDSHKGVRFLALAETHARPDPTFSDLAPVLIAIFAGMVGLVLFIACANVANLMLSRVAARQHEMVMRGVLGASRWRLVRQVLVESLVFAALAGAAGHVISSWTGRLISGRNTLVSDVPVITEIPTSWRDYLFIAVISVVAGLATGLVPALRASRIDLNRGLRSGHASDGPGRHRFRNILVMSQVTFSLVVLICAGMFLHSLQRTRTISLGFRPERLLSVSVNLDLQGYTPDRGRAFCHGLLEKVRAIPGVESAALTRKLPFDMLGMQIGEYYPENPPSSLKDGVAVVSQTAIDPGYLTAIGTPLLRGRQFQATDTEKSPRVAIVNEAMARLCWPGQDPLGKRFRPWKDGPFIEVVGVVPTGKYLMISEAPRPFAYLPLDQNYGAPLTIVVRSSGSPAAMLGPVRAAVETLDPNLPIYGALTLDEHMRSSVFALMPLRMGATLAGIQGAIGLFLALMGLYAVVSFGITQRTKEIGIRMALGADHGNVIRLVVREGMRLTLIGLGIGLVFAAGAGLALSRVLYGVSPADPPVFLAITALLLATTLAACYLPARRMLRFDPCESLMAE